MDIRNSGIRITGLNPVILIVPMLSVLI